MKVAFFRVEYQPVTGGAGYSSAASWILWRSFFLIKEDSRSQYFIINEDIRSIYFIKDTFLIRIKKKNPLAKASPHCQLWGPAPTPLPITSTLHPDHLLAAEAERTFSLVFFQCILSSSEVRDELKLCSELLKPELCHTPGYLSYNCSVNAEFKIRRSGAG